MKRRLTITCGTDADTQLEARKVCDFLFSQCGGNVSEAAVLMYLRRCKDQHDRFPHTKVGTSDAMLRACEAAGA